MARLSDQLKLSGLDHSYIKKPHHWDPRRVYSQTGADWQARVNWDRMREERLARAKMMLEKHGLDAMVLYTGANVRYVTGVYQGNWKYNIFIRYAVLCRDAEPYLFETVGADLECAKIDAPWLADRIKPAITWTWSEGATERQAKLMVNSVYDVLKKHKVHKEKVGIDIMDMWIYDAFKAKGVNVVNAWPAISEARVIKTVDELECLKQACAIGDSCYYMIRNEWLKPGVRESDMVALCNKFFYENGFEHLYELICASGGNTNPYRRWFTDKIIREGDLVIFDLVGSGPGGYFIDYVRTFMCGKGAPTRQQKQLYKEVYDSMNAAIAALKPGATTADSAKHMPVYDDDKYKTCSLFQFGHSVGLTLYEGMWISRGFSLEYPAPIKENMYFSLETYSGKPGLEQAVRLEQSFVITDKGPQLFTLFPFEEAFLS